MEIVFASNSVNWWGRGWGEEPKETGKVKAWQLGLGAGTLRGEKLQLVLAHVEWAFVFSAPVCAKQACHWKVSCIKKGGGESLLAEWLSSRVVISGAVGFFQLCSDICIKRLLYVSAVWRLQLLEVQDFNRGWLCRCKIHRSRCM